LNVLVTGGAGYIGSLTCIALIEAGFRPFILDNFANSSPMVIDAIEAVAGVAVPFAVGNVGDGPLIRALLEGNGVDAVIHLAGLKGVGESTARPLDYYANNVAGTLSLLAAMEAAGVRNLVFSSSAAVYGNPQSAPVSEESPRAATNPYGRTKLIVEYILEDLARAAPSWSTTILRYGNPVGAHPGGAIGENPRGVPDNLMPYLAQVAAGRRDHLPIYGADYPTADGAGVRDYIHVLDLAEGHVAALRACVGRPGVRVYNLGTGKGHSVFELLTAFSRACGKNLPSRIAPRRPGDVAEVWAQTAKAERELNWRARRTLGQMCQDAWRWQSTHPNGYSDCGHEQVQ
jgi:UDP-glucose 4-epimerase